MFIVMIAQYGLCPSFIEIVAEAGVYTKSFFFIFPFLQFSGYLAVFRITCNTSE
jgi:hypothetical protein